MTDLSLAAFAPGRPVRRDAPRPATPLGRRAGRPPEVRIPGSRPVALLRLWLKRLRERRQLERMALDYPCFLLRDVGLRREDLMREARKPFWRA